MTVKVIEIPLPEYTTKKKPDYLKFGKKVDKIIERAFPDGKYIMRAIGSSDHPNLEFGDTIWHFYEHTLFDRGYAVRIDVLLFYDPKHLRKARKFNKTSKGVRKGLGNYLYKFNDPKHKKDALVGIVKILTRKTE